jgi:hypothetical protein
MAECEAEGSQDWGDSDFIPIRDALAGKTQADNIRHAIVRSSFFWEFWEDENVLTLLSHWAQATGLVECGIRLACAGDCLAELVGLESRGDLYRRKDLKIEEGQVQEAQETLSEFYTAFDAFAQEICDLGRSGSVWREAIDFVLSLELPYPWLAMELIECFVYATTGFAMGRTFHLRRWFEPLQLSEITAPPTTLEFQTGDAESVAAALERLQEEFKRARDNLLETVPPRGRIPKRTADILKRNARWFYRHKVKGDSIRSIAISELGSSDRRKDVYDGIKSAEELLKLTLYTF